MQCAWALDHMKSACPLKDEWDRMVARGDRKGKAAVHVANKLLSIGWTLQRSRSLYSGFGDFRNLKAKLKREKLQGINTSSFPELA